MHFQFPGDDVEVSEREPETTRIDPALSARLDTLRHSIVSLTDGTTRDVLLSQLLSAVQLLAGVNDEPRNYRCKRVKPDRSIVDGCGRVARLSELGGSSKCPCGGFMRKVV